MEKDIFYLMHVPWGWIKQRPHFLAEQLNENFKMKVVTPKSFITSNLIKNDSNLKLSTLFRFPLERFKLIRLLNGYIGKFLLKYLYRIGEYKYIWITDLRLFPQIQSIISKNQKLIYDCMDDVLEFEALQRQKQELELIEKELFNRVDLVFFSSKELKKRKTNKYSLVDCQYKVVYNALDEALIGAKSLHKYDAIFNEYSSRGYTIFTYIGTISTWFDFKVIFESLNDFDNIVYFIIGPVEQNVETFKHDRIEYFGAVEHGYIKSLIQKSDVLVMPFKINKLIEAVDPVKLYEYIAFGKKIISVKYAELNKFSAYVNFYNGYDEYKNIIGNFKNSDDAINARFFDSNTWKNRKEEVVNCIEGL